MNASPTHVGAPEGSSLSALEALTRELEAGIAALVRNDLPGFESHLARQETLCRMLTEGGNSNSRLALSTSQMRDLSRLNSLFRALVTRSSASVNLLLTLYKNQGTGYGRTSPNAPAPTLSCEI